MSQAAPSRLARTTKLPMRNHRVPRLEVMSLKLKDPTDGFLFSPGARAVLVAEKGRLGVGDNVESLDDAPPYDIRVAKDDMLRHRVA